MWVSTPAVSASPLARTILSATDAFTGAQSFCPSIIQTICGVWVVSSWNCSAERRRSEEHTSELQSLMRISYAVFCLNKKKKNNTTYSKLRCAREYAYRIY